MSLQARKSPFIYNRKKKEEEGRKKKQEKYIKRKEILQAGGF